VEWREWRGRERERVCGVEGVKRERERDRERERERQGESESEDDKTME